ncbi:hypothetical protein LMG28138_01892 [Pararobbsia alpina]|uniref:DNA binding HTH domain-containing protein n=1 Tax=Pararobbsia alpina TaxID=621374 RepID=A0A6S7BAY3_9BURK|nr:hypothetical protein LMG28138_01892 [Pararobbsia alpina]
MTVRQLGWDAERLQAILLRARNVQPPRTDPVIEIVDRSKWDMTERGRVAEALDANGWSRQDTAQFLGISRKVLWEKMRKYRMFDDEPEAREFE